MAAILKSDTPRCLTAAHVMCLSSCTVGGYRYGFNCDRCGAPHDPSPGILRWHCAGCHEDFCLDCEPADLASQYEASEKAGAIQRTRWALAAGDPLPAAIDLMRALLPDAVVDALPTAMVASFQTDCEERRKFEAFNPCSCAHGASGGPFHMADAPQGSPWAARTPPNGATPMEGGVGKLCADVDLRPHQLPWRRARGAFVAPFRSGQPQPPWELQCENGWWAVFFDWRTKLLRLACEYRCRDAVRHLLYDGMTSPAMIKERACALDENGLNNITALLRGCAQQQLSHHPGAEARAIAVMRDLLDAGAIPDAQYDPCGDYNVLLAAVDAESLSVLRLLLDAGANPNQVCGGDEPGAMKTYAIARVLESHMEEDVQQQWINVLLMGGADPNIFVVEEDYSMALTPLVFATFIHGPIGSDPEGEDEPGSRLDPNLVRLLLSFGATNTNAGIERLGDRMLLQGESIPGADIVSDFGPEVAQVASDLILSDVLAGTRGTFSNSNSPSVPLAYARSILWSETDAVVESQLAMSTEPGVGSWWFPKLMLAASMPMGVHGPSEADVARWQLRITVTSGRFQPATARFFHSGIHQGVRTFLLCILRLRETRSTARWKALPPLPTPAVYEVLASFDRDWWAPDD